jgi:hypothetical protein
LVCLKKNGGGKQGSSAAPEHLSGCQKKEKLNAKNPRRTQPEIGDKCKHQKIFLKKVNVKKQN